MLNLRGFAAAVDAFESDETPRGCQAPIIPSGRRFVEMPDFGRRSLGGRWGGALGRAGELCQPAFGVAEDGLGRREGTEAAGAAAEISKEAGEVGWVEVGPEDWGEEKFGVGGFPEEEIGESLFAAGADEEVDGRADFVAEDGVATGIIDRQAEVEALTFAGYSFSLFNGAEEVGGETVAATDGGDPDLVGDAGLSFGVEVEGEKEHKRFDFGGGTFPVVR